MRFYVDVHRLANKERKNKTEEQYHVFTTDGIEFTKVKRVTDIPAGFGDELFVDVIPIELTDEFIELLRRGVKVYYLRRLNMIKGKREELGLKSKSSKNDLKALMSIESKWFREVDEDFLVMRRMVAAYRGLLRDSSSMVNRMKGLGGDEKEVYQETVDSLDRQIDKMARLVADEACRRIPAYNKVVEVLEINGDSYVRARAALAELMQYAIRSTSYHRLRRFCGLFKGRKGRDKFYSKTARSALSRLTSAILNNPKHRAADEEKILREIWVTARTGPRERLEVPA